MNPTYVSASCIYDYSERNTTIQLTEGYIINKVEQRPCGNALTYHATVTSIEMAKETIRLCSQEDLDDVFEHWKGGALTLWSHDQTSSIVAIPTLLELKAEWKPKL